MSTFDISTLDINSISQDTSFVLDANILYFLHSGFYTSSSRNAPQIAVYSSFISRLLTRGNKLYVPTTALQEFLYGFERKSYKLYVSANGYSFNPHDSNYFSFKQYRALLPERIAVKTNMDRALYEVTALYDYHECCIKLNDIDEMVQTYEQHRYDPMDYFTVIECKKFGLTNYISDDSDFRHDLSINVYYAS